MLISELRRTDQPLSTGATSIYPFRQQLADRYVFTSRFGDEVPLHRVEGNRIHLPRALCPIGKEDLRTDGEHIVFPKAPTPREHQIPLFNATEKFLLKGESGVVVAYTGWGKTVLGYHAAHVCQCKTLVVTTKDDIYQQWIDRACGRVSPSNPDGLNFLGLTPDDVGEIRGDKCEIIGTKFCVAMIHTLSKDGKYPPEVLEMLSETFGLVIFDECHRVPADQFSTVADMFAARRRLGLSATPDRADGKEILVTAHIGPIRARTKAQLMVPKVLRFQTSWDCPRVMREDPETGEKKVIRLPHQPGKTSRIEKAIAADPERNHLIAELAQKAYAKGRKTVIFSTLHDHLNSLHRCLVKDMKVPGKDIGYYVGATTKAEREKREKDKARPILLTTYTMMGEGTSIDWLDTCILAMPRSSVEQPVGRIRREYDGKPIPVVMDLVDHDSPVFSAYAAKRLRWYEEIGSEIKEMA